MHGLTGGSWKRIEWPVMVGQKNDQAGNRSVTVASTPTTAHDTAPVPDPTHSGEWVAASPVVRQTGLVLSASSPA